MTSLLVAKCQLPKSLTMMLFFQGVTFLILFANFYIQSYIVKNKSKAAAAAGNQNPTEKKLK